MLCPLVPLIDLDYYLNEYHQSRQLDGSEPLSTTTVKYCK